jgi:hypothetical protein
MSPFLTFLNYYVPVACAGGAVLGYAHATHRSLATTVAAHQKNCSNQYDICDGCNPSDVLLSVPVFMISGFLLGPLAAPLALFYAPHFLAQHLARQKMARIEVQQKMAAAHAKQIERYIEFCKKMGETPADAVVVKKAVAAADKELTSGWVKNWF